MLLAVPDRAAGLIRHARSIFSMPSSSMVRFADRGSDFAVSAAAIRGVVAGMILFLEKKKPTQSLAAKVNTPPPIPDTLLN